jgi:hypothetical protein
MLTDDELRACIFPAGHDEGIMRMRLACVRQALKFESVGMRLTRRGVAPTGLTICKKEYGLKAKTAKEMLPLFDAMLRRLGVILVGMSAEG